jgi:hypothetical protein
MLTKEEDKELSKIKSHCRRTYVTHRELIRLQELERKKELPSTKEELETWKK